MDENLHVLKVRFFVKAVEIVKTVKIVKTFQTASNILH